MPFYSGNVRELLGLGFKGLTRVQGFDVKEMLGPGV